MKDMAVKRQVRYSMQTDTGEQVSMRHKWTFVIVNEYREIERIGQRVLTELSPAADFVIHYENLVPRSGGLACKVFSIASDVGKIPDHRVIYNSDNFRKDRNLERARNEVDWGKYVDRLFS